MAVAGSLTYDTKIDNKGFKKGIDSLENVANTAMKGVVTAITAVSTAIVGIGVASVKSYADLEQNVGGIETLFKGSASKVIQYANNAYKTAGMSANEYMQTVTGFSASLLQSLKGDTEKASEVSNMALIDMSDNANKMGTSMESIKFAYQGFAKQNYTMLDNLKLGYGGTKDEMQRLLADAQKLTGVKYDITNLNDVFQAIHAIQEKLEITGTTAKEAEETISGSVASMKSAWDNFLNGSGTFDQFVDAAKIAFNNIAKAVSELLPRIASEIANALPSEFVTAVKIITPILVTLGTALGVIWGYFKMVSIVNAISKAFSILNAIMMANPIVLIVGLIAGLVAGFIYLWNTSEAFRNFWIGLWEGIKSAFETVWNAISTFFTETIPQAFQSLLDKISEIGNNIKTFFENLWNGIILFFTETIPQWIQNVITWFSNLPYMIGYQIGQLLGNIIQFGLNVWTWITVDLPLIIQGIIDWFAQLPGKIWEWLVNTYNNILQWATDTYNTVMTWIGNTINSVIDWFAQLPGRIWSWLLNTINNIKTWGSNMKEKAGTAMLDMVNHIIDTIKGLPGKMLDLGKNIVEGIWNGIKNAKDWIVGKVKNFAKGVLDGMKNALGIHSPSKLFENEVGKFIPQGVAVGIEADTDSALKAVRNMNDDIINEMNKAVDMETGSISAKASVKSNNSMLNVIKADFRIDGSVDIDGRKAGKILTPYMAKNLKEAGAY